MKLFLFFISFIFSIVTWAQNNYLENNLHNQSINYEEFSLKTVDKIALFFIENQLDSIKKPIKEWTNLLGKNEMIQRIQITVDLMEGKEASERIKAYIHDDFYYYLYDRFTMTNRYGYRREYPDYKYYYNYVPLNHPIDSILKQKAKILLEESHNVDEKLLLILFSGDIQGFDESLKKMKYEKGILKSYIRKNNYNVSNSFNGTVEFYTGIYVPQGEQKVFGNNPSLGVAVTSNLHRILMYGIRANYRLNINDKSFNYYALDTIHQVNSKSSFSVGYFLGLRLYDGKRIKIVPKITYGLEVLKTGIWERSQEEENTINYYDVVTSHTTFSLAVMTPIHRKSYMGIELGYHYVPYEKDKNLQTQFNNKALSLELFFRY